MKRIIFFASFIISCTANKNDNKTKNLYPNAIDSLHLRADYDSAKWRFYCIYCDDTVVYRPKLITNKTFGELDLQFQQLEVQSDSTILYFNFYFEGKVCTPEFFYFKDDKPFTDGMVFIKDKFVAYTSAGSMFWTATENKRYKNTLQPEVVNYIKRNQNNLDVWFREEAKRRGIIK